jgi:hypothetical protein
MININIINNNEFDIVSITVNSERYLPPSPVINPKPTHSNIIPLGYAIINP